MKSKIKMIALDMDGTVLNDEKEVTQYTKNVIEKAARRGVIVIACTGRPLNAVPNSFTSLEGIKYVISSNGARIVDVKEDEVIYTSLIKNECVDKLLQIVESYDTYREVFWDGVGYASKEMYRNVHNYFGEYMSSYIGETRRFVDDINQMIKEENIACDKVHVAFANLDERKKAIQDIKEYGDYELEAAMLQSIEITASGVNKGAGLKKLGEILGIQLSEIMAIGDGMNDASMLKVAGVPIAMGNAVNEIKALAIDVTDTNNEDGVAKAIEKFILT